MVTHGRTDGQTDGQTDRQTDRHDEANRRFSRFCERALAVLQSLYVMCSLFWRRFKFQAPCDVYSLNHYLRNLWMHSQIFGRISLRYSTAVMARYISKRDVNLKYDTVIYSCINLKLSVMRQVFFGIRTCLHSSIDKAVFWLAVTFGYTPGYSNVRSYPTWHYRKCQSVG
jgi:hypothetical protein